MITYRWMYTHNANINELFAIAQINRRLEYEYEKYRSEEL